MKVLGVLALIDNGETDWKVIALAEDDEMAGMINDLHDLAAYMPNAVESLREWLRVYKVCRGEPENTFGFGGEPQPRAVAEQVIEETHAAWQNLVLTRGVRQVGHGGAAVAVGQTA